jgi:hypothetical protein
MQEMVALLTKAYNRRIADIVWITNEPFAAKSGQAHLFRYQTKENMHRLILLESTSRFYLVSAEMPLSLWPQWGEEIQNITNTFHILRNFVVTRSGSE